MIRDKKDKPSRPVELDLSGPEGNVHYLMALAQRYAIELGLDGNAIVDQMRMKDYEHAVKVFDRYFGKYIIIYK